MSRASPHPHPLPSGGEGRLAQSASGERDHRKLLRNRAKQLRSEQTPAEQRMWRILRAKRLAAFKFKRQVPIDRYIADFVCLSARLIIEADGGQHAESAYDASRDRYLQSQGFRVLRFWNKDIFENEEGVTASILNALQRPLSPTPLPQGGEGLSGVAHV